MGLNIEQPERSAFEDEIEAKPIMRRTLYEEMLQMQLDEIPPAKSDQISSELAQQLAQAD